MEHRVAEQMNAVERYVLDEFTPGERKDFEAHLFDCPICGEQVRQSAIAIENVKQVFREEREVSEASRQRSRNQGWAAWLRVPVLIPSFAALALAVVMVYQNAVFIPALEQPRVLASSAPIAAVTREAAPVVAVDPRRPMFDVSFDVDDRQAYGSYTCEFQREGGASIFKVDCGTQRVASFRLGVLLPTKGFPPGRYVMILRPATDPSA